MNFVAALQIIMIIILIFYIGYSPVEAVVEYRTYSPLPVEGAFEGRWVSPSVTLEIRHTSGAEDVKVTGSNGRDWVGKVTDTGLLLVESKYHTSIDYPDPWKYSFHAYWDHHHVLIFPNGGNVYYRDGATWPSKMNESFTAQWGTGGKMSLDLIAVDDVIGGYASNGSYVCGFVLSATVAVMFIDNYVYRCEFTSRAAGEEGVPTLLVTDLIYGDEVTLERQ